MIAFAYARTSPKVAALYQALADGLVANIREVMPREEILMLTDDDTPIVKGVHHVMRIDRSVPLMVWRLKAPQMAHGLADDILFTEPDVRFRADVSRDFPADCEIAVTRRESAGALENKRRNTPYLLGMTFSRSAEFWRDAKRYCQKLPAEDQDWFGDMLAIADTIDRGGYLVAKLDGAVFNHVPNDPAEELTAKVVHYKGKRKAWLFPMATEAVSA